MLIYCCQCEMEVDARFTNGKEIYPQWKKLHKLPFWICDTCHNYVGTHNKTKDKTKPLGVIPTSEIRKLRQDIHKLMDPLWKSNKYKRKEIYSILSDKLGYQFHTANVKEIDDGLFIIKILKELGENNV